MSRKQRGNAFFLVLIAVALFAALSYALTKSGRSGGGGKEQAALYAAQIVQASNDVVQGVMRMTLSGTPVTSIVVGNPTSGIRAGTGTLNSGTSFCTSGATCLFAPDGGRVSAPNIPRNAFTPFSDPSWAGYGTIYFTGPDSYNGVFITGLTPGSAFPMGEADWMGVGTAAPDVTFSALPLQKETCQAINTGLGISGIPKENIYSYTTMAGKSEGCLDWNSDGSFYIYYRIVVAN